MRKEEKTHHVLISDGKFPIQTVTLDTEVLHLPLCWLTKGNWLQN